MADDPKSFWSSAPGLLTGLAAILTAATGLLAAFHGHNGGRRPTPVNASQRTQSQATQSQATPAAVTPVAATQSQASGAPSSFAGFWSGTPNGSRWNAVLNLEQSGGTFHGTFEDPCQFQGVRPIDSAVLQGNTMVVTISKLGTNKKTGQPMQPMEFDIQYQNGNLTGTYNQGVHHSDVTFTPGRQGCPAGSASAP
jgi:hypothetical protein